VRPMLVAMLAVKAEVCVSESEASLYEAASEPVRTTDTTAVKPVFSAELTVMLSGLSCVI